MTTAEFENNGINNYCTIYFTQIIFHERGITFYIDIVNNIYKTRIKNIIIDFPINIYTIYKMIQDDEMFTNFGNLILMGDIEKECEIKFMNDSLRERNNIFVNSFAARYDVVKDNMIIMVLKNKVSK